MGRGENEGHRLRAAGGPGGNGRGSLTATARSEHSMRAGQVRPSCRNTNRLFAALTMVSGQPALYKRL